MPTLAEILDTLAWYRPLEEIKSDEGILLIKISSTEVTLIYGEHKSTWTIPSVHLPSVS